MFGSYVLSVHNTHDIRLDHLRLSDNYIFDDTLHLVYCKDVIIRNSEIHHALFDAIDIDMSRDIQIVKSRIINSGNDAVDLMTTDSLIDQTELFGSRDKVLSVGENSRALVTNSLISENNIGLEVKDGSAISGSKTNFTSNNTHFSGYLKNWQYGNQDDATIDIRSSVVSGSGELENMQNYSKLEISNSFLARTVRKSNTKNVFHVGY